MKLSPMVTALVPLLATAYPCFAKDTPFLTEETMVVTANRFEQPLSSLMAPVEVITREEIEDSQIKSMAEALRRLPGVQVVSGGLGHNVEIYVRGTSTKHVLVLINGVRIGSATLGQTDFSQIPLTGIERLEFIRGPRAATYGSDAVAGVLNIITEYQPEDTQAEIAAGVGSDQYQQLKASAAGAIGQSGWGKLAVNHEESEGFSEVKGAVEPDDDGYRGTDLVGEVGTRLRDDWTLSLQGYYHDGFAEFDDTMSTNSKRDDDLYNLAAKARYAGSAWMSEWTLARNENELHTSSASSDSTFITERTLFNWQNLYQLSDPLALGGGYEWYRDDVSGSSTDYDEDSRYNHALYLMALYNSALLQLEGSIRFDDNQRYGNHDTWQAGIGYRATDSLRFTANAGSAFKAPSFNDLYFPSSGNPELKPEESTSYEIAIEGHHSRVNWRLAAFYSDIEQLIAWAPLDPSDLFSFWFPANINEAEIEGIELTGGFATGALYHSFSLEYLDPQDKQTGKQLIRRARHTAKWDLTYLSGSWQWELNALYRGNSYDDSDNTVELDGYTLVDLAASYFFSNGITVRGRVANLFNEGYETRREFNTQDRSYFATVSYRF